MADVLLTPVELSGGSPVAPRGVLANAAPAPEGWEDGGIAFSRLCEGPSVSISCSNEEERDPASSPVDSQFFAFTVEQSSGCSTLSQADREREATIALEQATDYALARVLSDAEYAEQSSFVKATDLGATPAGVVRALSELECAAMFAAKGAQVVIHASVSAAAYLADKGLVGADGRTLAGNIVMISAGYRCDSQNPQLWATGRVYASVGEISTYQGVKREMNRVEAIAIRPAIVAFNDCINYTIRFQADAAEGG